MKKETIEAFQRGENWAFNEIYRRFLKPIQSYVETRIPNETVAQEITQEIFLKVFRFSASYRFGFAFTTWLWTIARNTVTDFRKRPLIEQSPQLQESRIPAEEAPALHPGADIVAERRTIRKTLFTLTRALSPLQRRILWMRVVVQLPYQEIAKRLNMTAAAARSLVHRAKAELQIEGLPDGMTELL
jgi:RNA polymerase sigma-70 factor (ECF subfamily)